MNPETSQIFWFENSGRRPTSFSDKFGGTAEGRYIRPPTRESRPPRPGLPARRFKNQYRRFRVEEKGRPTGPGRDPLPGGWSTAPARPCVRVMCSCPLVQPSGATRERTILFWGETQYTPGGGYRAPLTRRTSMCISVLAGTLIWKREFRFQRKRKSTLVAIIRVYPHGLPGGRGW